MADNKNNEFIDFDDDDDLLDFSVDSEEGEAEQVSYEDDTSEVAYEDEGDSDNGYYDESGDTDYYSGDNEWDGTSESVDTCWNDTGNFEETEDANEARGEADYKYDTSDETGYEEDSEDSTPKPDMVLYVVTDRPKKGLINYMRDCGLNVSHVFNSLNDARDELLMQTEPFRLVVLDTGTGRFTSTVQRKSLIDLLGVCSDEDNKVSVFYTDSVIKVDAIREIGRSKSIKWDKYKNTAMTVSMLLHVHENFVYSNEAPNDTFETMEDLKDHKGLTSREKIERQPDCLITPTVILHGMLMSEDNLIEGFEPRL